MGFFDKLSSCMRSEVVEHPPPTGPRPTQNEHYPYYAGSPRQNTQVSPINNKPLPEYFYGQQNQQEPHVNTPPPVAWGAQQHGGPQHLPRRSPRPQPSFQPSAHHGHRHSNSNPSTPGSPQDQALHAIGQEVTGMTKALHALAPTVSQNNNDAAFEKGRLLGKGGFGSVYLCRPKPSARVDSRRMPHVFALKELVGSRLFRPGVDTNLSDFLPLMESSIQLYLKHESIVETYWADVRCLNPRTDEPIQIDSDVFKDAWTPLDNLADIERTYTEAPNRRKKNLPDSVKLQMRIAMEYCDLGSLKDYLVDPSRESAKTLAVLISQKKFNRRMDEVLCSLLTALDIAEALRFMHKSKTLHGDLKPHNILIVSDEKDEKGFRAKLSDFGLSAHMSGGASTVDVEHGTEAYLPIEVFQTFKVSEATDIYALGLLMWEIFYGMFWFSIWDKQKRQIGARGGAEMDGYKPSCSATCPAPFADIIHRCLDGDPDRRPSAKEVVDALVNCIPAS